MSTRSKILRRPIDRQKMWPWLLNLLDQKLVSALEWVNRDAQMFRISWIHGSRQTYSQETDAKLFKLYAIHTGRYDKENSDPKVWKTNFRSALRSLKYVKYRRDLSQSKGTDAFRIYQCMFPQPDDVMTNDTRDCDEAEFSRLSSNGNNTPSPTLSETSFQLQFAPGDQASNNQHSCPPCLGNLPKIASLFGKQAEGRSHSVINTLCDTPPETELDST